MSRKRLSGITLAALNAMVLAALILSFGWQPLQRYIKGHNDFLAFYAGAKLAFSDQLYQPESARAVQLSAARVSGPAFRFIRLPHYAVVLSPLGLLPFGWAFAVWQSMNLIAIFGAIRLWPGRRTVFANLAALWLPLFAGFINGQDSGFLLLGMVLVIRSGSTAGYLVCLIKYHLMWLSWPAVPRSTLLKSAGLLAVFLMVPCFWQPDWIRQYYRHVIVERSVVSQTPHTLFAFAGWYGVLLGAFGAVALHLRAGREMAFAGAVAIAVLVSPHGYFQDYTLTIPVVALVVERWRPSATGEAVYPPRSDSLSG